MNEDAKERLIWEKTKKNQRKIKKEREGEAAEE